MPFGGVASVFSSTRLLYSPLKQIAPRRSRTECVAQLDDWTAEMLVTTALQRLVYINTLFVLLSIYFVSGSHSSQSPWQKLPPCMPSTWYWFGSREEEIRCSSINVLDKVAGNTFVHFGLPVVLIAFRVCHCFANQHCFVCLFAGSAETESTQSVMNKVRRHKIAGEVDEAVNLLLNHLEARPGTLRCSETHKVVNKDGENKLVRHTKAHHTPY